MKNKELPCGWTRTGKMKDSIAHYRTCKDSYCRGRIAEWESMKRDFMKAQK